MSLHADALALLTSWRAPSARQESLRDRFATHLATHPDGLDRGCFPDHVTAGCLVLAPDGDRVLLNLHRKAGRWFAFGGHCEAGDGTLAGAALREATEESGLSDLDLHPEPVHLDEHTVGFCDPRGSVQHLDVRFAALAAETSGQIASEESIAVRWWPVTDLPDLEDEMHDLIRLARERLC